MSDLGGGIGPARYIWAGVSTAPKPTRAYGGQRAVETDTTDVYEWFGTLRAGMWIRVIKAGLALTHDPSLNVPGVNAAFHVNPAEDATLAETLVAVAAVAGDTSVEVGDATGFSVGDSLEIHNGDKELSFPRITVIAGDTLTLDRPLDRSYAVGDFVDQIQPNLAAYPAASLAAPMSFRVCPPATFNWKIARLIIQMTHSTAGDDSLFGNQPAIVSGVVLRAQKGGVYDALSVWRSNGDIVADDYDLTYTDKAGPGLFGTRSRWTFTHLGGNPILNGDDGDFLELLVQGDISGNTFVGVKAQGVSYG